MSWPLRYNISKWEQLAQCLSNNSEKLHILVNRIIQHDALSGTCIQVVHDDLGVLFAYLADANGSLIDTQDAAGEMSVSEILSELARFGFLVTFDRKATLSDAQIDFLVTLQACGFDKLRILSIKSTNILGVTMFEPKIVAFNIEQNPLWIQNDYTATAAEFLAALENGSAMNVSAVSQTHQFRWDWLDYVASIQDIIDDQL